MNCKPSEGLKIKTYRKSRIISGQYNSSLESWILPSCLCGSSFAHCLVPGMLSWALLNCHAVTVTSPSIPTPELSELWLLCDLSSPTPAPCSSFLNSYYGSRFQLWWHQNWGVWEGASALSTDILKQFLGDFSLHTVILPLYLKYLVSCNAYISPQLKIKTLS